uniref:Carboxypeptidase n=1 Tax=Zea mays TaxID=4577 RepID=A0A804R9Y8_MAIZE
MADHPLAAGRPGRVRRRARQLPGGGAAGRGPEAAELDVAAEGRPHLRGPSRPSSESDDSLRTTPPAPSYILPRHARAQLAVCPLSVMLTCVSVPAWWSQDNPVGVGYSYVEDDSLLVTTDWEQAADATALLKALAKEVPTLQGSPLFLVAESYGGKYAATLGVSVARAVRAGELKVTLAGVALGDSFVSPVDFTVSYVPLLLSVSRLDDNAAGEANKRTQTVKDQIAAGQFAASQGSWNDLLAFIDTKSGSVDVYNFLLDSGMDPVSTDSSPSSSSPSSVLQALRYSTYLGSQLGDSSAGSSNTIDGIMNGVIKEKLKIIPKDVRWVEVSNAVYYALVNDFMKPRIDEIDELLSYGVNVTVYNGQVSSSLPHSYCVYIDLQRK